MLGVVRLARGRSDGLLQFGATPNAFLASLAPLVGFLLLVAILMVAGGGGLPVISEMLATLCALIAPPVLTYWVARQWGREAIWLRFAIAFNWCQWVVPVIGVVALVTLSVLASLGLPLGVAGVGVVPLLVGYGLWLHWFIARHGLQLSGARAAVMVLGVNVATALIILGPARLAVVIGDSGELSGR